MAPVHENLSRAEARARAELVVDPVYAVALDLTGGDDEFISETTVTFGATKGASTHIDLTAVSVESATLNGRQLPASALSETRLQLDDLQEHNELHVVATMGYTKEGRGLHHFRDPADDRVYLHSQCEPFDAHLLFACFDQPDLKATFSISVDAPANWVVVSNNPCIEQPADGQAGTWRFATTPSISPYLVAVVAGEYASLHAEHDGMALGWYARQSMVEYVDADELFDLTRAGLDWFGTAFGCPYPFDKYDQLFVPEFSAGAMENPGCVTYNEAYVFRSKVTDASRQRRAETLLHEMAHMWFGDLVTMRWFDDLWLNESFATFMSVLCMTEATRFTDAWVTFLDAEKSWAKYQDQLPTTHPIVSDLFDVEQVHQNFDGITYAKGASVLRQLVAWVGQDAFLDGCKDYFATYAWGNAELDQFLGCLEKASGRDLGDWSKQWLETTGLNTFALDASLQDGRFESVRILQQADASHPTLRDHRVAVGVYGRDNGQLVRTTRVELDVSGAETTVDELAGVDAGEFVLVNDDDLTFAKVRLDDRSFSALVEDLSLVDSALARAQVWSVTWDMVRDAALPASRWIRLVMNNAGSESDVGVLQRLMSRSLGAADRYADPAHRDELLEEMAAHARTQAEAAEPGSDTQLAWVRHWASCARSGQQRDDVRSVLDGDLVIDGLAVDTDLRWHLVTCLAHSGAADDALIDAELERDNTDVGARAALAARAARPTPEDKAAAWNALMDDKQSHAVAREVAASCFRLDQGELLEPYTDRYLEAVTDIWERRSVSAGIDFAEQVFPHAAASEELLADIRSHLEGDVPVPLRRVLLEQCDILERTLKARALDAAESY